MTAPEQAETLDNTTASNSTPQPANAAEGGKAAAAAPENAGQGPADTSAALEAARKEATENHDRYLRAVADLENFRRRSVREKDELRQFAAGRVLEELLPVMDNLSLAIAAAKAPNADLKSLVGGVAMVQEQLKTALSNHGLKEVNPVGQKFDPNQHESISAQPSADVAEGSVLQVVRVGYSLNGRLLRPASVVLSAGPQSSPEKAAK